MKKTVLFIIILCVTGTLSAQTFSYSGINYTVTSGTTVKVDVNSSFFGNAIIPSSVSNASVTYLVTSIGNNAFFQCNGLTSVSIPNSITSIGEFSFYNCSGLTSINIPNSVTNIDNYAFAYCSGFTSVTIPNSVLTLGQGAFTECSGLTSVIIPNSITIIPFYLFHYCTSLTSVSIPNSITSIGQFVFGFCPLTSVSVDHTTPITINANVFLGVPVSSAILNVPIGTAGTYDATSVWTDFGTINAVLSTKTFELASQIKIYPNPTNSFFQLSGEFAIEKVEIYSLHGQLVKTFYNQNQYSVSDLAKGTYLVKIQSEEGLAAKTLIVE